MYVKMSELVKRSGEPKSTINYYIKEGLLPSPKKYKPNLYLYHISTIDRLKYISMLKDKFSFSIKEIKDYMRNCKFENDNLLEKLTATLALNEKINDEPVYFENDVLIKCKVSPVFLEKLIEKKIIVPKLNKYSEADLDMIKLAKKLESDEAVFKIMAEYSIAAYEIAEKEKKFTEEILKRDDNDTENLLFSIINDLKKKIMVIKTIEKIKY